jgi:hypothetical protein
MGSPPILQTALEAHRFGNLLGRKLEQDRWARQRRAFARFIEYVARFAAHCRKNCALVIRNSFREV